MKDIENRRDALAASLIFLTSIVVVVYGFAVLIRSFQ